MVSPWIDRAWPVRLPVSSLGFLSSLSNLNLGNSRAISLTPRVRSAMILEIWLGCTGGKRSACALPFWRRVARGTSPYSRRRAPASLLTPDLASRSEEHTSELQSQFHLVC